MTTPESPQRLHQRFVQDHDLEALGKLFDELAPKLLPIAERLNRSEHDAADALQETFLALVERRGHFDPDRELIPWVVGILINKSRGAVRRREFQLAEAQQDSSHPLQHTTPDSEKPEELLARFELGQALGTAIDSLHPTLRAAVTGRLLADEPGPTVAAAEGISQGALRVRLHRGRALLQRALGPVAATWFGSLLFTTLGLSSPRATLARLKRTTLQKAAGTTAKSTTAAATRLAPKGLATVAIGATVLAIALSLDDDPALKEETVSLDEASAESAPSTPAAQPETTRKLVVAPSSAAPTTAQTTFTASVLSLTNQEPLEGQTVILTSGSWDDPTLNQATTNAAGIATFEFPSGTGLRQIRVLPTATRTSNPQWINAAVEDAREVTLLVGLGATLGGVVLGPDDQPVPFAEVRAWGNERLLRGAPDRVVHANAQGQFLIEHLGPKFIVVARTPDLAGSKGLRGELAEGKSAAGAKLYLQEAVTRTGTVLDPDGVPLERADVVFRNGLNTSGASDVTSISGVFSFTAGSGEAQTDSQGHFSVSGLPTCAMGFDVTKFPYQKASTRFPQNGNEPITVRLERAKSLAGVVVDTKGRPVEGAALRAWPLGGTAASDASGTFQIDGLTARSTPTALVAQAEGYAVHFDQPVTLGDQDLRVQLRPERPLQGHIASEDLKTVSGLELWILSDHVVERDWISPIPSTWEGLTKTDKATTDANGDFAFAGLNPGALRLFISHPVFPEIITEVAVDPKQESLELTLSEDDFPKTSIEGTVTDALSAQPIPGVSIRARWPGIQVPGGEESTSMGSKLLSESDPLGHFEGQGLPPGQLILRLSKKGFVNRTVDLGALSPGKKTVSLKLQPERSLHVLLRDEASGKGRTGKIRFLDSRGEPVMIDSGALTRSSAFEARSSDAYLHGLPPEALLMTVESSGTEVTVPVDLTKPSEEPLLVYLPSPVQPPPPVDTVDVTWVFLELTSPLTKEEAALFAKPIDDDALRSWFLAQQKSGRLDTPQHAFAVTVEDATGTVFNSTTVTPTLHGDAPPTYTITREGRTLTRSILATVGRPEPGIEMEPVPSRTSLTTSAHTIEDARAAYVGAVPPVGRVRLQATSEDYEPLILDIDLEPGHKTGPGDMIFLTPK